MNEELQDEFALLLNELTASVADTENQGAARGDEIKALARLAEFQNLTFRMLKNINARLSEVEEC